MIYFHEPLFLNHKYNQNIVILTDSKTTAQAILQITSHRNKEVKRKIPYNQDLNLEWARITFQWIPFHIGITGSEIGDKLAKQDATLH